MAPAPVTVAQITDVDTYTVQLTLSPDTIVKILADTLKGKTGNLVLVRHLPPDHPEHIRALRELITLLADTFTVYLTPAQAERLGGNLWEATTLPEQCGHCEAFSVTEAEGIPLCQAHGIALDHCIDNARRQ